MCLVEHTRFAVGPSAARMEVIMSNYEVNKEKEMFFDFGGIYSSSQAFDSKKAKKLLKDARIKDKRAARVVIKELTFVALTVLDVSTERIGFDTSVLYRSLK